MRDPIGLMMKARSQARKNVSSVSAKKDRNVAAWATTMKNSARAPSTRMTRTSRGSRPTGWTSCITPPPWFLA
jgi:hypothetical protein